MKKQKNNKTKRVSYGMPFYEKGDISSPYIPFVVQFTTKHWFWRYQDRRYEFFLGLSPFEARSYVKRKYPNANIVGVYSMLWDKKFPNATDFSTYERESK